MGLKTASVIIPTCVEYYDSNRGEQQFLERRCNKHKRRDAADC
jgi:hypothetical protein